jgi:hypothetical protein
VIAIPLSALSPEQRSFLARSITDLADSAHREADRLDNVAEHLHGLTN